MTCWELSAVSGFSEKPRLKGTLRSPTERRALITFPPRYPESSAACTAPPPGYLLHRVPTAFAPCASSPSSSAAPAASLSWTHRGSSPRTPAAGRSGGCKDTGLVGTKTSESEEDGRHKTCGRVLLAVRPQVLMHLTDHSLVFKNTTLLFDLETVHFICMSTDTCSTESTRRKTEHLRPSCCSFRD